MFASFQNISSAPYVVRWLMKRWQMDIIWLFFSTFGEYDNNHDYVEGESNCLYIPNYDELDGIILCLDVFDIPGMAGKLIEQVKEKAHCPVISIRQKRDEFISVLSDDKKAIMAMVDHLIDEHNAKRIYYLSGPSYMHDIRMREDGFAKE